MSFDVFCVGKRIIEMKDVEKMKPNPKNQYATEELQSMGFAGLGENVLVDRTARFYGAEFISIGSNVRIDAYSVLSAGKQGIFIGNYVHLAVGVILVGGGRIDIEDFCGLSARVAVFSSSDDYSGGGLINPTIPDQFRNITVAPVVFRRHAIVGAGSVILPGVTIGLAASVGALSLVNKSVPDFMIVAGNPLRKIGFRDRSIIEKEEQFRIFQKKMTEDRA